MSCTKDLRIVIKNVCPEFKFSNVFSDHRGKPVGYKNECVDKKYPQYKRRTFNKVSIKICDLHKSRISNYRLKEIVRQMELKGYTSYNKPKVTFGYYGDYPGVRFYFNQK